MRRSLRPWLVWPLLLAMVSARPLHAAPAVAPSERAAEVPLAVEAAPVPSDRDAAPGASDRSDRAGASDRSGEDVGSDREDEAVPKDSPAAAIPATPRVPSPRARITDSEERVNVAVGLGPSAPGSKPEKAIVDALERSVRASTAPATLVRRLRAGAGDGRAICRERRDDLVILLEYMPDRGDPVLVTRDCRLDRELALRGQEAAGEPALVGVLWDEHLTLVRGGAKERKVRISRKVRTGLIAGGAILVVGVAIALVLANSLRRETVVLTVGP